MKPDNTPVTIADREGEVIIRETILKEFPQANFVGEEMGGSMDKSEFWTIDPIDGTKNFMRGVGLWSILIAYYKDGQFQLGVSYVPVLDEIAYGERGKGAFLNDKEVHVSKIQYIEDCYISHGELRYMENLPGINTLSNRVMTMKGIGDAWSYHLVASGRIDAMMEAYTNIWDVAPFSVIIEEAGGKFTNLKGEKWTLADTSALASNGLIHEEIARIVNKNE
jgi:histidinol-phosphatase